MGWLNFLKTVSNVSEIQDEGEVKKRYKYWRWRVFMGMYIGYIFYYFTRRSYSCVMPVLMQDLGFDKTDLGILGSVLSITYGASKFLSGILSDRCNPRFFMSIGLILTGIFNICFGMSSSIIFFAIFWGLNGWFQGWGWPPCAKLLTHWYSQKERGTWWGMWNTSMSVGGALIPVIVAFCATHWNWRVALYFPGVMCIGVGLFLLYCLRDTPQSMGLPAIEKFRNDYPAAKVIEDKKDVSAKEILFKYVLSNKYVWLLSISYFFIYIIRIAMSDWGALYFLETKGYSLMMANTCTGAFEVGGFCGSLIAGWSSDKIFKGKRGPVCIIYSLGVIFAVLMLCNSAGVLALSYIGMFSIGFLVFGPQMLIGMFAAEVSHKNAAGTASGFAGCWAYAGAAVAGYPLGLITQTWGWYGFFASLVTCGILGTLLLLPLWSVTVNPKYLKKEEPSPAES